MKDKPSGLAGIKDGERTLCEVWTRVMGYHRPVACFNPGKQEEYKERKFFNEPKRVAK